VNFLIHKRPAEFSWNPTEDDLELEESSSVEAEGVSLDIESQESEKSRTIGEQHRDEDTAQVLRKRKYRGKSKL
jgi:hypothetical protein